MTPTRQSIAGAIPTPGVISRPVVYSTLGGTVADIRHQKRMTQQSLADRAGISRVCVSLIECNRANNLTVKTLHGIATALQIDAIILLRLAIWQLGLEG